MSSNQSNTKAYQTTKRQGSATYKKVHKYNSKLSHKKYKALITRAGF